MYAYKHSSHIKVINQKMKNQVHLHLSQNQHIKYLHSTDRQQIVVNSPNINETYFHAKQIYMRRDKYCYKYINNKTLV